MKPCYPLTPKNFVFKKMTFDFQYQLDIIIEFLLELASWYSALSVFLCPLCPSVPKFLRLGDGF